LDQQKVMENLLKKGVAAYLYKPFGRSELLNIIENVLITAEIKKQTSQLSYQIDSFYNLKKDPYFLLPFSVLFLDENLFIKNANPKAIEEFSFLLGKKDNEPLPTLLERYSVNATRELQNACFGDISYPYSFMDFIYTPTGIKQANVTLLETGEVFEEYRYILIVDFFYHNIQVPDKILEILNWLEIFPVGIIVINQKYEAIHINLFARQKLKINKAGGSNPALPEMSSIFIKGTEYVFEKKKPYFVKNDGLLLNNEYLFEIAIIPIKGDESKLLILFSDYEYLLKSEDKFQEDEKKKINSNGRGNIYFSTTFLKKFAHNIRTPLNTIQGFSKLLINSLGNDISEQSKDDLNAIYRNGNSVSIMIDKLLDFARIKSGEFTLNKKIVDLNNIVEKIVKQLQPFIKLQNIKVEIEKEELPQINADETAIFKSLFYIIENACFFSLNSDNKTIKIETGIKDDKYIKIAVSDNGIGISDDEINLIFKPFYYGKPVKDRRVKGMGVGLYISEKLVAMHKGKINATSRLDEGTNIEVSLPIL
ncbi:MAG: HAMP domain-containing histidine kinase, partial [Calditrichia bacterium]|nr:HAMP domain-containing histidine kinase [Calditrichia bacterium]